MLPVIYLPKITGFNLTKHFLQAAKKVDVFTSIIISRVNKQSGHTLGAFVFETSRASQFSFEHQLKILLQAYLNQ